MDLLIQGGTVVTASGKFQADVAVNGGVIAAIGTHLDLPAAKLVNASGKYVLPGAIDCHTHMAMPLGTTTSADSYFTGTRAAVCGGVTTIFDYPVQYKGDTIRHTIESVNAALEQEACCDYAFHCCITDLNGGKILDEMAEAVEHGITSYKCYLVYRASGMMVDDGTLATLLLRAKELGALINVHCENQDMIDARTAKYLAEGKTSAWYHYMSRPEFVEAEADKRVVHWATHLNTPVYIVHMADKEGLLACIEAKTNGVPVFVETCPQYLEFTNEVYKGEDGRKFVCSPPIKGAESREALWQAIRGGFIDTVATDHCPFMSYEKDWGLTDFTKIPNGCAGVENMYPYMLDAANTGKISFEKAVELCSTNVARIFGCDKKGAIEVGKDADIVIYDPEKDFTVHLENMHSAYDHTIWEGKSLHGYPVQTYLRGQLVYDNGQFVGQAGMGKFVKRIPCKTLRK